MDDDKDEDDDGDDEKGEGQGLKQDKRDEAGGMVRRRPRKMTRHGDAGMRCRCLATGNDHACQGAADCVGEGGWAWDGFCEACMVSGCYLPTSVPSRGG